MLDDEPTPTKTTTRTRRRAAARPAGPPSEPSEPPSGSIDSAAESPGPAPTAADAADEASSGGTAKKATRKRATKKTTRRKATKAAAKDADDQESAAPAAQEVQGSQEGTSTAVLFQPPLPSGGPSSGSSTSKKASAATRATAAAPSDEDESADGEEPSGRRRRRRGGRSRGKAKSGEDTSSEGGDAAGDGEDEESGSDSVDADTAESGTASTRRRRRRRRRGSGGEEIGEDDPERTVVHVREPRKSSEEISSLKGSTRLEAKKQRRREGREQGRRRPPILTESEFLARREAVDRVMVVRQTGERTQIAVLEDEVLVEHYVAQRSASTMVGNVYLGKVQNVLPSMEAAFVDVGRGRNAVLYAGEVNWDAAGLDGQPRRIEHAMKSGDSIMVQVTKDPIGHKGARLTAQVSLPGRYLVYVPDGSMTGISRKLPDTERSRLKSILRKVVSDDAGVIVRTAAEGASEDELQRDVSRLTSQWETIENAAQTASAPALLYEEPDLTVRVIRDVFNEDFTKLVIAGDEAWSTVENYVSNVAPDLVERLDKWTGTDDVFAAHRIDEQLMKALDRKVWLPSGGYLIIDNTEAMTVIDVNTGKFTGSGGNLEETVTKNNLEAAEEIVRQLRLRDVGGIIVIDFIDMVLESNRELVLRRLVECLGRDRTKHQVAEVTSLGLVQMTRKRVGMGLLEAFSTPCEHCGGRGRHISLEPKGSPRHDGRHDGEDGNGWSGSSGRRGDDRGTRRRRRSQPEVDPEVAAREAAAREALAKVAGATVGSRQHLDESDGTAEAPEVVEAGAASDDPSDAGLTPSEATPYP